jgi:hypothetical protein
MTINKKLKDKKMVILKWKIHLTFFFKLPLKIKSGFGLLKTIMRMITNLYKKNMHTFGLKTKIKTLQKYHSQRYYT